MIKIDFHMHTVATKSDAPFDFDMEVLKKYVSSANLDAIAITNHNMFDLEQYKSICEELDITVYPGIEINLESGHLLLISDGENIDDFSSKCNDIESKILDPKNSISVDTLQNIYPDLGQYILIPHYDKKPIISNEVIKNLAEFITAGEVASPKKFMYCRKDKNSLVPVYFSDSRMSQGLTKIPVRHTYLGCEGTDFPTIKNCLCDKNKVSLSENEASSLFEIFDDGQQLSTGLNVVLGERSSGKSYTLNKINHEFENIKYIKQFSLVTRDEKKDEERFNKFLSEEHSLLTQDYLGKLQNVVNDVIDIDIEEDSKSASDYINSLLKYATESERHDSFSKSKLFSEEGFQISNQKGLKDLISSTNNLVSNKEFKGTIEKYVLIESLKKLYVELMEEYIAREQEKLKQKWVNELINNVKGQLRTKTATTPIEDIDLYRVAINLTKVEKFDQVVTLAQAEREIEQKNIQGFKVVAKSQKFKGAMDLKKLSKSQSRFSNAYSVYDNAYKYLQELKKVESLEGADFFKYFVKIEYKVLNDDGFEISGGERSEFNLLQEIQDAQKYDMLLIDEPESSFDNIFLRKEVNEIIKDISKNMPVVLVTHNSTVGASIKPDYILYTKKERVSGDVKYQIYSGFPASKNLVSRDGKELSNFEVTMSCLESGESSYKERSLAYENLKN